MSAGLDPRLLPLIDALAELAVEDYLRSQAGQDAAPSEPVAKPVPLPATPKAA